MRLTLFNLLFLLLAATSSIRAQESFSPSFPADSLPASEGNSASYSNTGRSLTIESKDEQEEVRGQNDKQPASRSPIPLAPRSRETSSDRSSSPRTPGSALTTVIGSLTIVLALFLLLAWFTRRTLPNAGGGLPKEVLEVLGFAPLAHRQQMQLVRLGNKLVLLCVSATGTDALAEITDPEEVDRLSGLCQQNQPGSITSSFRQVFAQFGEADETEAESGDLDNSRSLQQFEA